MEYMFTDVAIYRTGGMFGVARTDCKTLVIKTGQLYAQYNDAIRVEYLEPRKRTIKAFVLTYKPWLRVMSLKDAVRPDGAMVAAGDGSSIARYLSCDPRYATDFEDKIEGLQVLYSVGAGDREGEFLERNKAHDRDCDYCRSILAMTGVKNCPIHSLKDEDVPGV